MATSASSVSLAVLTLVLVPLAASAQPSRSEPRFVRVAQVRHLDTTGITVSAGPTLDGGIAVEGTSSEVSFRKTVAANGTFSLELASGRDKVLVQLSEHAIRVTRNGTTIALTSAATEADLDKVARLLADSRAVRRMRASAAALQPDETSGAATALVLNDALVGILTGDVGASARAAERLTGRVRARLRPAAAALATDCYYDWEHRVLAASYEQERCFLETWPWSLTMRMLCAARWVLQVESYWVTFITCSGLNF